MEKEVEIIIILFFSGHGESCEAYGQLRIRREDPLYESGPITKGKKQLCYIQ